MKILCLTVLLFILVSLAFANAVIIQWKADSEQDKVILQWKTSQENDISKFVIERSIDNKNFYDIGEIASRGPGYQYQFEDNDLGKVKSTFYYRLRIVNNDGTFEHNDALQVYISFNSIAKTWGTIKAWFQ